MTVLLIRINCPDEMCAANIGETLIDKRLAACVNIEGPVESIYVWEDEMVREEEWIVVAKAQETCWDAIEAAVLDLHPHEAPAILAIPCVRANSRYAEWLKANSRP